MAPPRRRSRFGRVPAWNPAPPPPSHRSADPSPPSPGLHSGTWQNGATPLPRTAPAITAGQVRRAVELARTCGDLGDDLETWAAHLLDRLPGVSDAVGWSLLFPDADLVLVADGAGSVRRRRAAAALTLNGAPLTPLTWEHAAGWAWTDRRGRRLALLRAAPRFGGGPGSGDRPRVPDRVGRLVARGLRREGRRLSRPGDPAPGGLKPKAREVLFHLLRGRTERQIADAVGVTPGAVHKHVHRIYKHFGVTTRGTLLARWVRRGWGRSCRWRPDPRDAFGPPPDHRMNGRDACGNSSGKG